MKAAERLPFGVSGCRLSDGKLHLGHFVGCFHPEKTQKVSTNFFIVQDNLSNPLGGKGPNQEELDRLISQIYSLPQASNTVACLQSNLFPFYAPLYDFGRASISLDKLRTVHPKRDDVDSGRHISVRDYLFPVDEAVQFMAFRASFVLMNDDNERFVNLAKFLRKKLSPQLRENIPEPELLRTPIPRLLGSDGQKMAKANGNCVFFTDDLRSSTEKIRNYARKLGWRYLPDGSWVCERGDEAVGLEAGSPLSTMAAAFLHTQAATSEASSCVSNAVESVISEIIPFIADVQSRARELIEDRDALRKRFSEDNARAIDHVTNTVRMLLE